jgi:glycosyltransferase involved in cell wall biosynthesis
VALSVGVLAFPMASPVWGGNPWATYKMVNTLATLHRNDTFHLVFYGELDNEVSRANVGRLLKLNPNVKSQVLEKGKAAIRWCEENMDVVWGPVSGILRTERVPQVFTLHDMRMFTRYSESYTGHLRHRAGLDHAMRLARVAVVISRSTREEALKVYHKKEYERKVDLVYWGVPQSFDDAGSVAPRMPPGLGTDDFITVIYDPLPQKRMDLLRTVVPILDGHGWEMVCIGALRGGRRDRLVDHPRVHYLGYVEPSLFPAYIKASRLFLFPSEYEGFGTPPYEAMSLGVPVLYNARCRALREEIGQLSHSFDSDEALPGALEGLIASERTRVEHVDECLQLVRRFSWEKAARQYMYLFQLAHDRAGSEVDFSPGKDRPSIEAVAGGVRP